MSTPSAIAPAMIDRMGRCEGDALYREQQPRQQEIACANSVRACANANAAALHQVENVGDHGLTCSSPYVGLSGQRLVHHGIIAHTDL